MSAPAPVVSPEGVVHALGAVRGRIERAGGDPSAIAVVAVTKDQPADAIDAALAAGLVDLGENRADALVERAHRSYVGATPRWHYLATVQRNKLARLAPIVTLWQAVDRAEAGAAIAHRAPGAAVLVQVNLTDDPRRGGAPLRELPALVADLRADGLDVRGVMAVGPPGPPEAARDGFRAAVAVADEFGLPVRSLGMSVDLEVAVACGSTMVRIGAALFGARPRPRRNESNTVD